MLTNQAQFEAQGNPWYDHRRDPATTFISPNVRHAAPKRAFKDPPGLRQADDVDPEAQARRERIRAALAKGKPKPIASSHGRDSGLRWKKDARDVSVPQTEDLAKRIADAEARSVAWDIMIEQRREQQRARILAEYNIHE